MQNQINHWRKNWPEGDVDDATGDSEVLNMFAEPEPPKPPKARETYPFKLDEDVITTNASIKTAEKLTKKKLTNEGVKNSGMDMLDAYDNGARVWERNTPFGNTWDKFGPPAPSTETRAAEPGGTSKAVTVTAAGATAITLKM